MTDTPQNARAFESDAPPCAHRALWLVAIVAVAVNAFSAAASKLWVTPISFENLELAADIADRFDFTNELFLLRPPGYPLMLAGVFALFGSLSPTAILILQHGMAALLAVIVALIALRLAARPSTAALAGILCALSPTLVAYANVLLPEIPYTLGLMTSLYYLVRYHQRGRAIDLALASTLAGVSYLLRPLACVVVGAAVAAWMHRAWWNRMQATLRRTARVHLIAATAPAAAIALAWSLHNAAVHQRQQSISSLGIALYHRTAFIDKLDSPDSAAVVRIRRAVDEAKRIGCLREDADARLSQPAIVALRRVERLSLAEAARVVGDAAFDLLRAHATEVLTRSPRYAAWMFLQPDSTYRFHPGGASGLNGRRAEGADLYDIATYSTGEGSHQETLTRYLRYLPSNMSATALTPWSRAAARWVYRHIDQGRSFIWPGRSPYEVFMFFCVAGGLFTLTTPQRATWVLIGLVAAAHVAMTVLIAGHDPRYAVPLLPILFVAGASLATRLYTAVAAVVGRAPATMDRSISTAGSS